MVKWYRNPQHLKKPHPLGFRGSDFCLLVISYNYHETFTSTSCLGLPPDAVIKHRAAPTWTGEGLSGSRFNCLSLSAAGEEFKQKPWRNTVGGACSPMWAQLAFFCIQAPSSQGGTTQCALGRQYQSLIKKMPIDVVKDHSGGCSSSVGPLFPGDCQVNKN